MEQILKIRVITECAYVVVNDTFFVTTSMFFCSSNDEKIFKEESIDVLKILRLINNVNV